MLPAATHVVGVASPFDEGGARSDLWGRDDGIRRGRPRPTKDSDFTPEEAKALVEPILAAGDDTMQVEVGGPVAALSETAPFGTEGIGLHRRSHHLAVHLRIGRCHGAAADHRRVRPRHRGRARRAPAPRRRCPRLGATHRGDGRPRRGHRLRTAHRHPVPQQPRRRTRATPRNGERDRHRGAGRGVRRPRRDRVHARDPPGGPDLPERLRIHRVVGRPARHDRLADPATGPARVHGPQHRTPPCAVRSQGPAPRQHLPLVPVEPFRPAPALGRCNRRSRCADRPGRPAPGSAARVPGRPERPAQPTPRTRRTPCSPTASGPASRPRWSSRSRAPRTRSCCAATDALGDRAGRRGRRGPRLPAVVNDGRGHRGAHRDRYHLPSGRGDRGAGRPAARHSRPRRHRGHRSERRRRWDGGCEPRHHPRRCRPSAALLRRRAAGVVPAVDDGLPLGRGPSSRR